MLNLPILKLILKTQNAFRVACSTLLGLKATFCLYQSIDNIFNIIYGTMNKRTFGRIILANLTLTVISQQFGLRLSAHFSPFLIELIYVKSIPWKTLKSVRNNLKTYNLYLSLKILCLL